MPPANSKTPRLTSVAGQKVAFTGTLSVARRHFVARVGRGRGIPVDDVTGGTDIVVQGAPSPAYKWGDIGVKLARVEEERSFGRLVYVIEEHELECLLAGKPLSALASEAAAAGTTSVGGVAHRRRARTGTRRARRTLEVDLDERDRRLQEHHDIVEDLADALEAAGHQPLDPLTGTCAFDLAWQRGKSLHVVEVKTTTPLSEAQQIRLGLGQVLEYRTSLEAQGWKVAAHLVVSDKPAAARAVAACHAVNVPIHGWNDVGRLARIG